MDIKRMLPRSASGDFKLEDLAPVACDYSPP